MLKQFVSRKLGTLCGYKICFLNPVTFKESAVPSVCFPQGRLKIRIFKSHESGEKKEKERKTALQAQQDASVIPISSDPSKQLGERQVQKQSSPKGSCSSLQADTAERKQQPHHALMSRKEMN